MLKRIDLLEELRKEEEHFQDSLIDQVKNWIFEDKYFEDTLFETTENTNFIDSTLFEKKEIYGIESIKDISIQYNLRFLNLVHFQDQIPYEAIMRIKEISRKKNVELKKFKILAPAERFNLKDPNADPILFAELNSSEFLFIHKWGTDLHWTKKVTAFPFRNFKTLLFSLLLFSGLCASIFPTVWFGIEHLSYFNFFRLVLFFWTFVVSASITSYLWFLMGKDFSSMVWNSKYF